MLTLPDYLFLWGVFFVTGLVLGFLLAAILMQPGRHLKY